MIRLYQRTLSPDHGPLSKVLRAPVCRFHPTCSEYGHAVLGKHGLLKGSLLTGWRIMRCNPWTKAGFDPVP
ncbi:membrane protein insertion efficiency factor YidD [Patescibacteria group bacterium]|nr:membrane protein insertion efficiency factor YidD [Patescibacteria group bacterium]MBU1448696.1 membrane protein insertion efficiency factor YidD [Patescibacteria group bacterium]